MSSKVLVSSRFEGKLIFCINFLPKFRILRDLFSNFESSIVSIILLGQHSDKIWCGNDRGTDFRTIGTEIHGGDAKAVCWTLIYSLR